MRGLTPAAGWQGIYSLSQFLGIMLDKAKRSLASSERLIENSYCDVASSRAYYAVLYVMQAVLLTKEITYRKERAIIRMFSREFVRTGVFPKQFGAMVRRLYKQRWVADERFDRRINRAEAELDLKTAEEIVRAVVEYLVREGYIEADDSR